MPKRFSFKGVKRFLLGKKKRVQREKLTAVISEAGANGDGLEKNLVIQVLSATNLPKLDVVGHSDPYVKLFVTNSNDKDKSARYTTLVHDDTGDPVWNSTREIECTVEPGDLLRMDIFDYDLPGVGGTDDFIGRVCIPIEEIMADKTYTLALRDRKGKILPSEISFRRLRQPAVQRKRIYLIRHGESKWNEAQESNNLVDMLKTVDHALNEVGVKQAQGLERRWKPIFTEDADSENPTWRAVADATEDPWEAAFFSAQAIFASPLTRAVETALLGLHGHPTLAKDGLTLLRNLREVKNVGGQDTVGKEVGPNIKDRVKRELASVIGEGPNCDKYLSQLHTNDCTSPWWSNATDVESAPVVSNRLSDVTSHLKFVDSESIILVGHSLYFREFVRAFMSEEFKAQDPALSQKIIDNKLANAACLGLEMDFSDMRPKILGASFMFGTTVADH